MSTDYRALCAELLDWAERTSSHYYKQADVILRARTALNQPEPTASTHEELRVNIKAILADPLLRDELIEGATDFICKVEGIRPSFQPDQDDKTLNAIRETTPRYRMSVIVSTTDSAIDTRMNVIWQALDLSKEILESVSLPEQLPPLGSQ